ncbi:MAG: hypothetical protein ACRC80_15160, partial [Waterburya sp.]
MSEDLNRENINSEPKHSNSKLIYDYTESYLKYFAQGIDSIKQKATTALGFAGVLLKFSVDLPSTDIWLICTKIGTFILLIASIVICLILLNPKKLGDAIEPSELFNDYFYAEEDVIRSFIIRQWIETCEQIDEQYDKKAKQLSNCYSCIGLAAILFAFN